MAAGLDHARGDVVVLIDADLQDPRKLILPWSNGVPAMTMFTHVVARALGNPGSRRQALPGSTG